MNTFNDYWRSLTPADKKVLAKKAISSTNYINQIVNGHKNAGLSLVKRLMAADENVTFCMFLDDGSSDSDKVA